MRVIIGCEFSGVVRDEFRALGHDAWSCDLLESERGRDYHIRGDILNNLWGGWDMLIFHWPCTRLCNSSVRWLYGGKGNVRDDKRWEQMEEDAEHFRWLLNETKIPKVCGENPIPHRHAAKIMGKYSQIIQPWQFGHGETKATCLWLRGLPLLRPTNIVAGRTPRVHYASPGPHRWKERSRTYPGIAKAMASQWGGSICGHQKSVNGGCLELRQNEDSGRLQAKQDATDTRNGNLPELAEGSPLVADATATKFTADGCGIVDRSDEVGRHEML